MQERVVSIEFSRLESFTVSMQPKSSKYESERESGDMPHADVQRCTFVDVGVPEFKTKIEQGARNWSFDL